MATAYSNEVSVGTYNRIRIKCDYSGTSATCTVQFRRTQAYNWRWNDERATLTFNGTTKSTPYSYRGTVSTNWINLVSASGYSVSASGGTYNWSFSNPGGGVLGCSGSIYIGSQGTAPSQLAISLVEATWNSVTMETTVGNWGTGTNWRREAFLLEVPYVAGADKYLGFSDSNSTQPVLITTGAWTRFEFSATPFTIYGCKQYHTGLWAHTTVGEARYQGPTFYTAPYPLKSLTYSSESVANGLITATLSAVTDSQHNLSGATVGFLYQVSSDGGETFDGWKDLSTTVTVGTTASLSIPNLQPGTAYVVEVAQICMDADIKYSSESSFVNFTTKKYRKTYGPGASGYVTSTFTDDAKHTVENTADHTLLGYSLLGKTEQTRTTGKNIFKVPTNSGYTILSDNSFTATINRTASSSMTYSYSMNFTLDANTQYTLSFDADIDGPGFAYAGRVRLNLEGSWTDTWSSNGKMTFTTGSTGATTFGFYMCWGESTKTGTEIITWKNIQLEKASSASAFEPYSNGIASPSPDWSQPVLTATGAQTITITGDNNEEQTYELNLGKNLLNLPEFENVKFSGLTATCKNGVLTVTGATGDTYFPSILFYPDGSYITTYWWGGKGNKDVSKGFYTDANTDYMLSSIIEGSSLYEVSVVYESSAQYIINGTGTQYKKINKNERLNCVGVGFRPNKTVDVKIKLQLERGSTSTGWAPYFTPIELNKLDTYQDRIYRNNGKWYVHKEMGKHTFNGSETWSQATASDSGRRFSSQVTGIKSGPQGTFNTVGYSTHFLRSNGDTYVNYGISGSTGANVYVRDTKFDSMDGTGVKSWFASNPTDIWYVLATATDTEITYAPLVKQLETLYRLGHTSIDATTFDRNGYGNATVGLEVKTANASSLPVGFTPLEYIESTGAQYINSGYTADHNTRIVVEYAFTNVSTKQQRIFGYQTGSGLWYSTYLNGAGRAGTAYQDGSGQWWQIGSNDVYYAANTKYRMDYNGLEKMVTIYNADGSIFAERDMSNASATKACDGSMIILANQDTSSAVNNYAYAKLYSFQMYDVNGIVRDFVPCKTIDNKVGLYDKVTKKFYPSATATAFTAGPVDSTLVTKQLRKLYGAKPAKKNLLDVPLNLTVTNSNHYKDIPVALAANKTYTLSVQDFITDGATSFLVSTWNGSTEVGSGARLTATDSTFTFTRTGDVNIVRFYSSYNWADSGSHTTTFHGLMIEEGNEATTYQAYSDGGKAGKAKKIKKLYGPVPAQVNLIHVGPLTQIDSTQTSQGMTSTKRRLTCEEVNIQGTAASTWADFGPQYSVNWPAGTYTLTVDHPLPFNVVLRMTGAGDKTLVKGNTSLTFTTTATATAYYLFNSNYSSGTTFNETFKIQLVKGSTPDYDFKLYSDGTNANTTKLIYND